MVITEYCKFGNLRNYLKKHRKDFIDQIDPDKGVIDPTIGVKPENLTEKRNSYKIRYSFDFPSLKKKFHIIIARFFNNSKENLTFIKKFQ